MRWHRRQETIEAKILESRSNFYLKFRLKFFTSDGNPSSETADKKLEHTERAIEKVETLKKYTIFY
jgi:intein/homing endonuclease